MGSSKIILVSGLCVMLGFYAYVIQKASQAVMYSATDRQARTQARALAMAGVYMSDYQLRQTYPVYSTTNLPMQGGYVTWTIWPYDFSAGTATVRTRGIFGPDTVTATAWLSLVNPSGSLRSYWKVSKLFIDSPVLKDMPYRITR